MEPQSAGPAYRQPLLVNGVLLLLTGLVYLNLRAYDVDYGGGATYPEPEYILLFFRTLWLYPIVNFSFALWAQGRRATIYGLLSAAVSSPGK